MKTKILILLLTSFLFISCSDEPKVPYELPPKTQEGKGTAGCYINNELFVLSGNEGMQQTNPRVIFTDYLFQGYKQLSIGLSDFHFSRKDIYIYIYIKENAILENNVPLLYNNEKIVAEIKDNKKSLISGATIKIMSSRELLDTFEEENSSITFSKIDKQNKILSGTFSFKVKNEKTGEILEVTDGRFDLKMNYKTK